MAGYHYHSCRMWGTIILAIGYDEGKKFLSPKPAEPDNCMAVPTALLVTPNGFISYPILLLFQGLRVEQPVVPLVRAPVPTCAP